MEKGRIEKGRSIPCGAFLKKDASASFGGLYDPTLCSNDLARKRNLPAIKSLPAIIPGVGSLDASSSESAPSRVQTQ